MASLPTDERDLLTRWLRRRWLAAGVLALGTAALVAIVWTGRTGVLVRLSHGEWSSRAIAIEHHTIEAGRPRPGAQADPRVLPRGRKTQGFELVRIDEQAAGGATPGAPPVVRVRSFAFGLPGPLSVHTSGAWVVDPHGRRTILLTSGSRPRVFHRPDGVFERRLVRASSTDPQR